MTDERIDIEITDKVSTGPAKKLRDIASAATQADTALDRVKASLASVDGSALTRLANASARLTNAQAREVSATARLEQARSKMITATSRAAVEEQRLATEAARTEAAQQRAATATAQAEAAKARAEAASLRLAAAKRRETAATQAATAATRLNTAAQQANAASTGLASHQLGNMVHQVQDVGVSLASGQNPFVVMIQQGSQIASIYGPGTGLTKIMKGFGQAIFSIARQFAPVLAVVGAGAAVFGILTNEINKTTDVSVTMGDTMKATMQLIGEAIYDWIQPAVNAILPWFQRAYDFVIDATKIVVNGIIGGFKLVPVAVRTAVSIIPSIFEAGFEKAKAYVFWALHDMLAAVDSMVGSVAQAFNDVFGTELNTSPMMEQLTALNRMGNDAFVAGEAAANNAREAWAGFSAEAERILNTDYAGQAFDAIRQRSIELAQERIAAEEDEASATGGAAASLSRKMEILQEINKPLNDYIADTAALNELLREGLISIGQYNQALSELALVASLRDLDASLVGTPFADEAALEEIRMAEQERLNIVEMALQARIIAEEEAAARVVAIQRQAALDIQEIEAARNSMILTNASDTFGSLAEAAKGFAGEQSGIYKALFITSKAFAIADSIMKIQQGIANAMALPFPANLAAAATVAAQAASIVANIKAVQFADGGHVTGPGGPRDDKIPAWLSNGEFVVNAAATRQYRPLLEAINNNRAPNALMPRYAEGGRVQASSYSDQMPRIGGTQVNVNTTPQIRVYTRDPETRVEFTETQRDAATARRISRGQRNL
ncbi:tail tape-measure protein [Paracoccus phage vB_PmaS-R3]|uniref:Tail tape-measure protein n=1 Tax=Paracoccus phage vB_PmaS-R3 TaxID=2494563 RepID=A0A0B5A0F2_9CAUD|nr:tail length tape measure protein [Paracoccus phage vB_PmaS-R3]AJD83172.1 tail tape-measure protein [Paracoccus phage vB_PmaS-R3]